MLSQKAFWQFLSVVAVLAFMLYKWEYIESAAIKAGIVGIEVKPTPDKDSTSTTKDNPTVNPTTVRPKNGEPVAPGEQYTLQVEEEPVDPVVRIYDTLIIGNKTWLKQNLFLDKGRYCYCYGNKRNCQKNGRLYSWNTAQQACAALGNGWRLPTDEEWKTLATFFGGYHDYSSESDVGDPTTSYVRLVEGGNSGFGAVLGGFKYDGEKGFKGMNKRGMYWTSSEIDDETVWAYEFGKENQVLYRVEAQKEHIFSCRCIKDN